MAHITKPFTNLLNKRIDIWWRGQDKNADLMLLFSYLIRLNEKWKKVVVNIYSVVNTEAEKHAMETHIQFNK